jgi:hypothetical protein
MLVLKSVSRNFLLSDGKLIYEPSQLACDLHFWCSSSVHEGEAHVR